MFSSAAQLAPPAGLLSVVFSIHFLAFAFQIHLRCFCLFLFIRIVNSFALFFASFLCRFWLICCLVSEFLFLYLFSNCFPFDFPFSIDMFLGPPLSLSLSLCCRSFLLLFWLVSYLNLDSLYFIPSVFANFGQLQFILWRSSFGSSSTCQQQCRHRMPHLLLPRICLPPPQVRFYLCSPLLRTLLLLNLLPILLFLLPIFQLTCAIRVSSSDFLPQSVCIFVFSGAQLPPLPLGLFPFFSSFLHSTLF